MPRNTVHRLHPPILFSFRKTIHSLMFANSLIGSTPSSCSVCCIYIQGFLCLCLLFMFSIFKESFLSLATIFCFMNFFFYFILQIIVFWSSPCSSIFFLEMLNPIHHMISICLFFYLFIFFHFSCCLVCFQLVLFQL